MVKGKICGVNLMTLYTLTWLAPVLENVGVGVKDKKLSSVESTMAMDTFNVGKSSWNF